MPRTRTSPEAGRVPTIVRSRVDFPAPFGPIRVQRDVVDDLGTAVRHRDVVERDTAHQVTTPLLRRRTRAKNGAPKKAVTTPMGTSKGA